MAANVSVSGMPRTMGGLRESQVAFHKHHKDVGDALLNISGVGTVTGGPVDKDEPRMPYVPQEYPKMVFHPEHGELIVQDEKELEEALRQRYRMEPYPKPQIALEDPKVEKKQLQDKLKQQEGVINQQNDLLMKLTARMEALEGKTPEPIDVKKLGKQ